MTEKDTQEAKIRAGVPKRSPVCYQTLHDITIPAGTMLRSKGSNEFTASYGSHAKFSLTVEPGDQAPAVFKRVVAA